MNSARHKTQQEALYAATQKLQTLLAHRSGKPTLLMLSGGSALSIIEGVNVATCAENLIVTMLDERFSSDPEVSNFAQLAKTEFYTHAKACGVRFIDTRPAKEESIEALAERLNNSLTAVFMSYRDLAVIATIGMGADGHTAGIMPHPEDEKFFTKTFINTKKCYVGYDAGTRNQFPLRVTATCAFLKEKIDHGVVYAVGTEKKGVLENVHSNSGTLHDTPVRILRDMNDVTIFTDI